jgi:hypothetical protein
MKISKYRKYLDNILLIFYMIAYTILISGSVMLILFGSKLVGTEVNYVNNMELNTQYIQVTKYNDFKFNSPLPRLKKPELQML